MARSENRWWEDTLKTVKHAPWNFRKEGDGADAAVPEGVRDKEREKKLEEAVGGAERTTEYVYVDVYIYVYIYTY